ncbi:E3 ubiquitin-protein ligase CIP8 [Morella rubra]|uniref:RING-type E3 ubiquitin transferase n=1 Tax=Morella rubra TaxID=262757 RepID=A0A6A1UKC1_9ROSI|nr:E3 ubiquitin-protein ligase CIP8 [Morella rubra]
MAEEPSQSPIAEPVSDTESLQYWCYHCDKRVSVETLANLSEVICHECKNGFVESIPPTSRPPSAPPSGSSDQVDDPSLGSQFLQVLRLMAQAARDEDAPPPPPRDHSPDDDFLRIELDGWDNDEEDDDPNDTEFHNQEEEEGNEEDEEEDRSDNGDQENQDQQDRDEDEEDLRRRRRDLLRVRIQDFVPRARSGRNRILDWAEILMGLEDSSIEFRLEVPDSDQYVGNPDDYVDADGYEALLQALAENDISARRGAPPAAKAAVSALPTVQIASEQQALVCAICKDMVNVGETATKLPCGHEYHGDCIVPWLGSRNSCPVCRFELPTEDPDYEEERQKRGSASASGASC